MPRTLPLPCAQFAIPAAVIAAPAALLWTWWDARPRAIAGHTAWNVITPVCAENYRSS